MKKIILLLVFFVVFFNTETVNAQVPKNYVVVEIGTGTWCPYCPGAAMGADDLVENGQNVAVIENHNGDSYTTTFTNARNAYYGINSFPTAMFNGGYKTVGGDHNVSMYSTYLPIYNTAIAVQSDFSLDLSVTESGGVYQATIELDEPGSYAGTNLTVHLVVTESHIVENWQGQSELNFVSRGMYPDYNGTAYSGDAETMIIDFTPDPSWAIYECELVAFIQDNTTKEILQADKITLAPAVGTNNAEILNAEFETSCESIEPTVHVRNAGAAEITSFTINYDINSGAETGSFPWTGNLEFNQVAHVTINDFPTGSLPTNDIVFEITDVNATTDDDNTNNTLSMTFDKLPDAVSNTVHVEVVTDNHGNQLTWRIWDLDNNVLGLGNGYGNNETYTKTVELPEAGCYYIKVIDVGHDGGCAITMTDDDGNVLYHIEGDYGDGDIHYFATDSWSGIEEGYFLDTHIYPNPSKTVLNIENAENLNVSIIDVLGRVVFSKENLSNMERINTRELDNGTYVLKLTNGQNTRTEKIIISN